MRENFWATPAKKLSDKKTDRKFVRNGNPLLHARVLVVDLQIGRKSAFNLFNENACKVTR
jgi:hypothetical protein